MSGEKQFWEKILIKRKKSKKIINFLLKNAKKYDTIMQVLRHTQQTSEKI